MGRYDRQILEIGEDGQKRLGSAKIGIIGCGGLGTNVATALAMAGINGFVIMDPDYPEESNLNRQYVYCSHLDDDPRRSKSDILADWMCSLNPSASVASHTCRFDRESMGLMSDCDILMECLDSVGGRMEANRCAVELGKPLVHGGIDGFHGEVMTIIPGRTPCLHCVMGYVPEMNRKPSSIGAVVSAVGSMEATEAIKLLLGRNDSSGDFLSMDFEKWRFQTVAFERDPNCPVCRSRRKERCLPRGDPRGIPDTGISGSRRRRRRSR